MEDQVQDISLKPLRLFVKLLNGKTATLNFSTPRVYGHEIKNRIHEATKVPTHLQRLIYSGLQLKDGSVISDDNITFHLVLPLLGGKGGFGSLLRGAATKAGQKKTNNFDACRDMSGRRLRHVNAEKKLEEWKAEEEERRLERIAEEFIKKAAKKGKKGVGDGEAEKYVARYREESAKCVAKVEESVREACGNGKRKAVGTAAAEAKKLKIWMGKRKLGESEDEDSDDDDGEENEKSIVLNNSNQSDSNKETEGSTGSVTGGKPDGEFSGGGSSESGSEEEKEILVQQNLESSGCSGEDVSHEENAVVEPEIHEEKVQSTGASCLEPKFVSAIESEHKSCGGPASGNTEEVVGHSPNVLSSGNEEGYDSRPMDAEATGASECKSRVPEEAVVASTNVVELERPLDFNEFNSAVEMEAFGMERLKSELQVRGLKCGGTLQERAARLFLLKSTPVEKLPKKLLAKK
ncbi:replication stress response regulator SDE2 [Pistacia vera]|uniref:replication stress response regulator SDE2 n=1 Tax=Pistacia vera TaxID=55513 RepID=UPI0012634649|nr:replication stress response regulator SDE2 [Pistacia vera]